jgi:HD-GYP domain-containing protein (c-di-GMP phosphodiesterase class II)
MIQGKGSRNKVYGKARRLLMPCALNLIHSILKVGSSRIARFFYEYMGGSFVRLAVLNDKVIGKKLEMPIFSSEGTTILSKGSVLTEKIIARLRQMGVGTVYINDENYEEVLIQEILDTSFRLKTIKILKQLFEQVKKKKDLDPYVVKEIVTGILDNMAVSENSIISFNNIGSNGMDICNHSLNVTILSTLLGISRGYNYSQLSDLGVGALLHDIGKLIADDKFHPEEGFKFLREYRELSATSNICAYSHHENVDGTGYPRKIKGDQIYDYAKIVSLCNEYDLLHSSGSLLPHEVLERISAEVGKKFDADFYNDFIKVIYCYPNGLPVRLSSGQEGVVVMQNKSFPQRPVVKVKDAGITNYINLMEKLNLFIEAVTI